VGSFASDMKLDRSTPSPELLAANEYLLSLRAQAQNGPAGHLPPFSPVAEGKANETPPAGVCGLDVLYENSGYLVQLPRSGQTAVPEQHPITRPSSPNTPPLSLTDLLTNLPEHLGWGSEPLIHALRSTQARRQSNEGVPFVVDEKPAAPTTTAAAKSECVLPSLPKSAPADPPNLKAVKLYPDIGLAMLREEQTAAGRIWLLLRGLDQDGTGWLEIDTVKRLLTRKKSPYQVCGWRQLRNLLREGDGLYWQRDKERIWLRSAAKVALGLGIARLTGRPVMLSVAALLNGIGRFRAELYAAFHSGRVKTAPDGTEQVAPIARETLTNLSGLAETTQRRYEAETAVSVQSNYAIGNKASPQELEEKAWRRGNAVFTLEDTRGRQGPKGEQYVAWQLPNSYGANHQQCPKGRQRRINRQLKDLVMKGMPGNIEPTFEADALRDKLYYPTGKLAAQAFNRGRANNCYWQQQSANQFDGLGIGRYVIWQHLEQRQAVS
jgi:hypothetical protein